jgi:TrmH family RNA methyltransferase
MVNGANRDRPPKAPVPRIEVLNDRTAALARPGRHGPVLARLRRIARGDEPGLTAVDGAKLVLDLLDRGVEAEALFVTEEHLGALADRAWLAGARRARVHLVDDAILARVAPTTSPQGLVAVVRIPRHRLAPAGVAVYLDRVQDPGNVGAVIRSAAAFGATGVATSPGCASPFSWRSLRASAGHALLLPVEAEAAFAPLADRFRAGGGEAVAASERGGTPLARLRPRRPLLLVVGNEGQGIAPEILSGCDRTVTIPIAAAVESLNVTVAASVILASLAGGTDSYTG